MSTFGAPAAPPSPFAFAMVIPSLFGTRATIFSSSSTWLGAACRLLIESSSCYFSGMRADELAETRAELEAFVEDVFASLPRADQRDKGNLYLYGRRESMQSMGVLTPAQNRANSAGAASLRKSARVATLARNHQSATGLVSDER